MKTTKSNILHISTTKELRGGDLQLINQLKNCNHLDFNHHILCVKKSKLLEIAKLNHWKVFSAHKLSNYDVLFSLKIFFLVRKYKINIIQLHDSTSLTLCLLVKYLLKNVNVIYIRKSNNSIKKSSSKKYNSNLIRVIVCVSESVKSEMENVIKDKNKLLVIKDGINLSQFNHKKNYALHEKLNISKSTKIIGIIASLSYEKDLFTFIKVAKTISETYSDKIRFVLVGEGNLKNDLVDFVSNQKMEKLIHFYGFATNVNEILPNFDVLLSTSIVEGLGVSVLEAFACGVPVVATRAGGLPESVQHNHTGLNAEILDFKTLAQHTIQILENENLKFELIKNAKEYVHKNHNIKNLCLKYDDLYLTLITH